MEFINEAILHAAGQWWIYPILTIFCFIDGFVPILPSETLIVALGALSVTSGEPNMWFVMAAAAVGAIAGDNMAYLLGRHVGVERFRWMRKPKVHRALNWARYELDKRGAMLIFTARYIPVGRVAVNWIAGTTAYPRRRFVILDIFASITWVAYSAGVGIIAGNWVHEHPLLGVGIAIAFAIVLGIVIDHALTWLHRWRDTRGAAAAASRAATMAAEAKAAHATNTQATPGATTAATTAQAAPAVSAPRPASGTLPMPAQLAAPADVEA
ncbi:membrane protein DedA with SNARE-associated domain [Pseudarthrobacter oxydans]|uniref:DedA family protein n=1 Tax=Pseudarthrobacter oxydans TaxID=1671 RepID=UPI002789B7AE|nr:DedA family protein [Pseudarthrobacter oxydans]MDP9981618.1 membrane protein DedA with SNARE-associated domain [Pseudarthrobacter oxydans]